MKHAFRLLRKNSRTLMEFEFLFKLLSLAFFLPLITALFNLSMRVQGYRYLTAENLRPFLRRPFTLASILILLVFLAFYSLLDICSIIYILDRSHQGKPATLLDTIQFSLKQARRFFLPKNLPFFPAILLLVPLLKLGSTTSFLSTISIPTFLMNMQYKIARYSLLILLGVFILFILIAHHIYLFHYFALEKDSFHQSAVKSRRLTHGHASANLMRILLVQLSLFLLYILAVLLITFVIAKAFGLLPLRTAASVASSVIWAVLLVLLFIFITMTTPFSLAIISQGYYEGREENSETVALSEEHGPSTTHLKARKALSYVEWAVACLALGAVILYNYLFDSGRITVNAEYLIKPEITAHRGASAEFPENTMAAFQGALDLGADWIELDVAQSKDGQLFICHDSNLKRVTGVKAYVWELTYEEIASLDAGSHFSSDFAQEKMPLLSEVLAFAKENDIRLNIELKPTGHEAYPYETAVVDLIHEYEMEERCVVASQKYASLVAVKEYDPEIRTVYVMPVAYGSVAGMEAADAFSIHASFISRSRVLSIHAAGKDILAWTLNDADRIAELTDLSVDNIITDDIPLAIETVNTARTGGLLEQYLQWILPEREDQE